MADQTLHATCVACDGRGALIRGVSGSGKSALALMLMSMGATLVSDDRVRLSATDDGLWARAPETITGLIEARGIGLLKADTVERARVVLVVDLDHVETARLPPLRTVTLSGREIPLIYAISGPHFAAAILQILRSGWSER